MIEWPELPRADEHTQARPRWAAEVFGEGQRFGTVVQLGVDQDGCAVIEQETCVANSLAVARGIDHAPPDERTRECGGRMTLRPICVHEPRVAAARSAVRRSYAVTGRYPRSGSAPSLSEASVVPRR